MDKGAYDAAFKEGVEDYIKEAGAGVDGKLYDLLAGYNPIGAGIVGAARTEDPDDRLRVGVRSGVGAFGGGLLGGIAGGATGGLLGSLYKNPYKRKEMQQRLGQLLSIVGAVGGGAIGGRKMGEKEREELEEKEASATDAQTDAFLEGVAFYEKEAMNMGKITDMLGAAKGGLSRITQGVEGSRGANFVGNLTGSSARRAKLNPLAANEMLDAYGKSRAVNKNFGVMGNSHAGLMNELDKARKTTRMATGATLGTAGLGANHFINGKPKEDELLG